MSRYLQELCDSLCRVLDHCAELDRRRLAGHVANIDFWVAEIQHRLSLIDGYEDRRRKMMAGTDQVYADDIRRAPGNEMQNVYRLIIPNAKDVSTDWKELEDESVRLRSQILASAKRFVKRCIST